jgi:NAD(P)-dependent dehydrogenase (short-subunit alcohol dehydrogenase family)
VADGLADKTVVVTGAAGSFGHVLVETFLGSGARVVAVDIDGDALAELHAAQPAAGQVVADISLPAGADAVLAACDARIDVLVNNAAVSDQIALLDQVSEEVWRRSLAVNLTGPFLLCRRAIPGMLERGGGVIVNISSTAGLRGGRGGAAYTASKWGLVGLTENIAATHGDRGIRCNAICPGNTGEGMGDRGGFDELDERSLRVLTRDRGKPEAGRPEQIASVALFLAGDGASRVNGAAIPVDAGWIAY